MHGSRGGSQTPSPPPENDENLLNLHSKRIANMPRLMYMYAQFLNGTTVF